MKVQNRDTNVDILRIIACLAVVGLHTLGIGISRACDFLYYQCGFAVPIFFMASGYMLLARNNTVAYSIRKISRLIIFTLLWYCVLLPFEIEGGV